ncbi:hypothetical protein PIB30_033924 [Stylosanthes scabra]|uniref:Uncharacterized protein n=1 Tax=Stylosanthes scabra TaxID=79078 RepID=A0ABU6XA90_9FABA|nr:hypothetical protein [Stylosanthes scabra]
MKEREKGKDDGAGKTEEEPLCRRREERETDEERERCDREDGETAATTSKLPLSTSCLVAIMLLLLENREIERKNNGKRRTKGCLRCVATAVIVQSRSRRDQSCMRGRRRDDVVLPPSYTTTHRPLFHRSFFHLPPPPSLPSPLLPSSTTAPFSIFHHCPRSQFCKTLFHSKSQRSKREVVRLRYELDRPSHTKIK